MEYGCFVTFGDSVSSRIKNENIHVDDYDVGDKVEVEILWVNSIQKKIGAKLLSVIEEEYNEFMSFNH